MPKILLIGDLHFRIDRLQIMTEMCKQILEQNKKINPDAIVVLGDTLHYHNKIEMEALCLAIIFFKELKKYAPLHILIGNHDRINNSQFQTRIHPFSAVEEWDNAYVYFKAEYFSVKGYQCVAVPYVPIGKFSDALETLSPRWDPAKTYFVFSHQEYKGSIDSQRGDSWPETFPLNIAGHIHEYKQIQSNLLHIGTPHQHQFVGSIERSISLLTIDEECNNYDLKGYTTNNTIWYEKRLFLKLPVRNKIKLSAVEIVKWNPPDDYNYYKIIINETTNIIKALKIDNKVQQLLTNPKITIDFRCTDLKIKIDMLDGEHNQNDFITDFIDVLSLEEKELLRNKKII